ncbi:MAG: condensation domain-containing protein [Candidatus Omnitrophota bacterium]
MTQFNDQNKNDKNGKNDIQTGLEVAVIGMAGRFPGARNLNEFWENIANRKECATVFTDDELLKEGIDPQLLANPNYVKVFGALSDVEYFDASFFGYTPSEANVMHPQMRFFHECAWLALEDAGYSTSNYEGLIGVYAGARTDIGWELNVVLAGEAGNVDSMTAGTLGTKDHLATRISYMFNLRGPSYTMYTACSTSLVAIHLGCQAVLSGECDMALAGGVTIMLPQKRGYLYSEGMVLSPDGHTRSFDAEAKGLISANGIGVVVLKPLEDAIRDRDHIYAVIKGSAINNDGNRKIGYTASSIKAQETLIKELYRTAEVDSESIMFVECHGSATPLGDPVEVEALRRSFHGKKGNLCGIGSIKSNIGHCDCASGVAGFIKTVLALEHRSLPPNINFKTPNPKIDFENSPFYVVTELREWKNETYPLRAAVNSLGLGGTNAHVILQEAPSPDEAEVSAPGRNYYILPLSAKTPTALDQMVTNLLHYFRKNPDANLADVAYTLQEGRTAFLCRRAFVCSTIEEAINLLSAPETAPIQPHLAREKERPIVFMFSGQGSEYINMGRDLYETEETFRRDIDRCFDYLTSLIGEDIKYILYPQHERQMKEAEEKIHRFYYTQPVKFIFEYAYSHLLMRWGFTPHAMIGFSFGEYIVSCLAGVFSIEDALKVLMKRGEILEKAPFGNMLSVSISEAELIPSLKPGLYIGGVNTDELCLLSGTADAIDAIENEFKEKNINCVRYRVTCAAHSPLMDPILPELGKELEKITYHKPSIPFVSGLTGTWMTVRDALDPSFFNRQLREPIRFSQALKTLFETPYGIYLEVGPGTMLANFANYYKTSGKQPDILVHTMVRHHKDPAADDYFLLNRVAQLWTYGRSVRWDEFYGNEKRRRVSLPGYPFEPQYYWNETDRSKMMAQLLTGKKRGKRSNITEWLYIPSWKNTLLSRNEPDAESLQKPWMVFMDRDNRGEILVDELRKAGRPVIVVHHNKGCRKTGNDRYPIDFCDGAHYQALFKALKDHDQTPETIIHLGNLSVKHSTETDAEWYETVQDHGYHSLLHIAQAIGRQGMSSPIQLEVVTNGMQGVAGETLQYPEKATILGPVKIIPQEYPNIKCRAVDVQLPEPGPHAEARLVRQLNEEFLTPQTRDQVVAYRGDQRLVQYFEPAMLETPKKPIAAFRKNGVYLITGGLGGVGLIMADYLAREYNAKLVLTSRFGLMPEDQWETYLRETTDPYDITAHRIRSIRAFQRRGVAFMIEVVDVADEAAMRASIEKAEAHFGPIHGVIHSAYTPDGTLIERRTREISEAAWRPKIQGAVVLDRLFQDREPLDCFVLCSSLAGIFGPIGQVAYAAASAFQDAFAQSRQTRTGQRTVSIDWCSWSGTGGLVDSLKRLTSQTDIDMESLMKNTMQPQEGIEAFLRIMNTTVSQALVSTEDLSFVLEHLNTHQTSMGFQESLANKLETPKVILKRPQLRTDYLAPRNRTEERIARVWQDIFGLETIGVKDDFFELGGDSLKAMTVSSKIYKEMGVKVPIAVFFAGPTIEDLAVYIGENERKDVQTVIPRAEPKDFYPCSLGQARIYHLHDSEPGQTFLNITTPVMLPFHLEKEKLDIAFKKIIERHDIYRTSFHLIDGRVMIKVHSQVDFQVDYRDASEGQLTQLIHSLNIPFDLSQAPLFRIHLIRLGEGKHVLVYYTHHIVTDGTSARMLFRDFVDIYSGKELPPIGIGYKDYCQWQYDRIRSGKMEESGAYWLDQLNTPVPAQPLVFPADFPRPNVRSFNGRDSFTTIERDLMLRLRSLSADTGATLFMIWLAAYNILLHTYTGNGDIVMGIRTANRTYPGLEGILGKFSNDLAFRSQPQPEKPFKTYLHEVKERTIAAFNHQEFPYELLIERFNYPEDSGRNPLFSTVFVFNNNNMEVSNIRTEKISFTYVHQEATSTLYDILFQATELGDTVNILFLYNTDIFKRETIERMKQDFVIILERMTQTPEALLSQIGARKG